MGDSIMHSKPAQSDLVIVLYVHFMRTPVLVDLVSKKHAENHLDYERDQAEENHKWCARVAWYIVESYWEDIISK